MKPLVAWIEEQNLSWSICDPTNFRRKNRVGISRKDDRVTALPYQGPQLRITISLLPSE